jgi:two-component system, cell cycle sensor histidine kinase and response regulator CckA
MQTAINNLPHTVPIGIGIIVNSIIAEANHGLARMMGYSRDELIGCSMRLFCNSEVEFEELFIAAEDVYRWRRKDGSLVDVSVSVSLADPKDIVSGIVFAALDLTGLKWPEEARHETEDLFRSLSKTACEAFLIHEQGVVLDANLALARLFGYERPEDLIGRNSLDLLITPESRVRIGQRIEQRETGPIGVTCVRQDGSTFAVDLDSRPVKYRGRDARLVASPCLAERKRVEDARRESVERYRSLFELSMECVFLTDLEGRFLDANQAALDLIGYRREDIATLTLASLLTKDQLALALQAVFELLATGCQQDPTEYRLRRKDGRFVVVETHCSLVYREGQPLAIQGIARDITERKLATDALRESEAKFRTLFENAGDAILIMQDHRFIDCNAGTLQMFGCQSRSQILGESPYRFSPPLQPNGRDSREFAMEKITAALAGRPQFFEWMHAKLDGTSFPSEVSLNTLELGGIALVQVIVRDISTRRRAEEDRERALAMLETSLAQSPAAIVIADAPDVTIRWVNPAALAILGETHQPPTETDVRYHAARWQILQPDGSPYPFEELPLSRAILKGEVTRNEEQIIRNAHGETYWTSVNAAPIRNSHGSIISGIVIFHDITERKRAEEEKAKLHMRLHRAQKMESIGRLAGGVAHDFNNMLTVINGYSQLEMARLSSGDPLRTSLVEIHKAGERAANLTRQLLAFSRKQVLQPLAFDLNRLVEEMRPMLERLVGEDVEVRVVLHAEGGTIHADPHQLEQVVMNLVVNARDAMPGGGSLLIETADVERDEVYSHLHPEVRAGRYIMLAVSDNGTGMDEATRQRVFEPFFTTKEVGEGKGLGLSAAEGIVVQSGGHVNLYSEPGHGTTFKIYLPAFSQTAPAVVPSAPVPELDGTETVLVVEDQEEVREYAVKVLKGFGYHVIDVASGDAALRYCEWEHRRIHLLLTDVMMPNMSGRKLANRLREVRPQTKVLFMSGYTDDVILHNGMLEQGVPFIQKPFSPEELAGKVRAVLGPPAPRARILVADDEARVRGFLREVLTEDGYEVVEAANGKEAIEQARARVTDLVITDLVMPEQEGLETIQALRQDVPGTGIIAISGAFEGQFLKPAQLLGANAVLSKPINPKLLLATVAEVLARRP